MNGREKGFLLLTSHLGDPQRKVLTVPQLRALAQCVRAAGRPAKAGELTVKDLIDLGYSRTAAEHIIALFSQEQLLEVYLQEGRQYGCVPLTRVSTGYPLHLRKRLGLDSPGCLWAKGDISLLDTAMISLVGSRDLQDDNLAFAREAGRQAALQGITLVSGNARGADTVAQEACLENGGSVISVVADRLDSHAQRERVLYLSEDGYDLPFSVQRALSRNRIIHSLGYAVLIAQCTMEKGGTWDGTVKNLRYGWSPVFCFADASPATVALTQMGAGAIEITQLSALSELRSEQNLFDQ